MFLYEALENRYISWGFFFFFSAAECSYSATLFLQTAWHHAAVPAFMAVWGILEHRLHLLLGWGGESGCGLVTVRHGSRGRSCPTDGRSGPPLHLFFLLQLIRLQVHVRGGHGALHVWITAASREKQASLPSYRSAKTWMFFFFFYWSQKTSSKYSCQPSIRVWHEPSTNGQKMLGAIVWNECGEKAAAMN